MKQSEIIFMMFFWSKKRLQIYVVLPKFAKATVQIFGNKGNRKCNVWNLFIQVTPTEEKKKPKALILPKCYKEDL